MLGTVKRINRERGFAFIARTPGADVFLHVSGMLDRAQFETMQEGEQVEYDTEDSEKGVRAIRVRVVSGE